jgi:hypothetical protein
MKPTLLCALFLAAFAIAVRAEDMPPVTSVQFKDGKLFVTHEGGKTASSTNEVAMPEGIKVMTNGTFTVNAGKPRPLKEGQSLGADGNLTSPNGTVVPVFDHLVMKAGKLTIVKNGEETIAKSEVTLDTGARVKPDGTVTIRNGTVRRMLDGQIARFSGEQVPTTDTVTIKDGQVILQKDGGRVTLRPNQSIMMSDGTKVFGDGTVLKPDGVTKEKVKEGEILKLPGVGPIKR